MSDSSQPSAIEALFDIAMNLDDTTRETFMDLVIHGDKQLGLELEELLEARVNFDDLLDRHSPMRHLLGEGPSRAFPDSEESVEPAPENRRFDRSDTHATADWWRWFQLSIHVPRISSNEVQPSGSSV